MPLAPKYFVPYEMKTSLVRIYSYADRNPVGTLKNPLFEGEKQFRNLTQLIFMLEELQDELKYPEPSFQNRTFLPTEGKSGSLSEAKTETEAEAAAPLATLKINILFRQNASWQGNVVWMEQATEANFRSALELITLIDSILYN